MGTELTTVSKILVAAAMLEQERETFTAEDLIVRAWKAYPESFGLNGYRESHPDSNRVLSKLMGSTGLCSRGWLEQVATKQYRLTAVGRKIAASLQAEVGVSVSRGRASARSVAVGAPAPSEHDEALVAHAHGHVTEDAPARSPRARSVSPAASTPPATNAASSTEAAAHESSGARPRLRSVPGGAERSRREATTPSVAPEKTEAAPGSTVARVRPMRDVAPPATAESTATTRVEKTAVSPAPSSPVAAPKAPAASVEPFGEALALGRLAVTPAAQKFTRGGLITYADACAFWGIVPGMPSAGVQSRLADLRALLARAEAHIARTGAAIRVHDRLELTLTSVVGLQGLHTMLSTRYARELEAATRG